MGRCSFKNKKASDYLNIPSNPQHFYRTIIIFTRTTAVKTPTGETADISKFTFQLSVHKIILWFGESITVTETSQKKSLPITVCLYVSIFWECA